MSFYRIDIEPDNVLRVGFGESATNEQIICDAGARLDKLIQTGALGGGKLLKVNGPASMPVAMLLGHKLAHLYETVACYDPKLTHYVVVSTHGGEYSLGELVD